MAVGNFSFRRMKIKKTEEEEGWARVGKTQRKKGKEEQFFSPNGIMSSENSSFLPSCEKSAFLLAKL